MQGEEGAIEAHRVRVLESVPGPGKIVKYIDEVVRYAPDDIEFTYFSWPRALFGRYDVFHVHWPEYLVRGGTRVRALVKRFLFEALLLRLKIFRTPIVRTVHNVRPHDAGHAAEASALARLEQLVVTNVTLNSTTPVPATTRSALIPHGDFREVLKEYPRAKRVEGRILLFGRIEPYKGVIELLEAAEGITAPGAEIRIVGRPSPEMRAKVEAYVNDPNRVGPPVSVDLREVSDEEMVREMTAASLVILPYRDAGNGNTGVGMVALSLDRPIAVPDSPLMRELAAEVGSDWVHVMPALDARTIENALAGSRSTDGRVANLKGRDWPSIAAAYAGLFRDAITPSSKNNK